MGHDVSFGRYRFDSSTGELWSGKREVRLTPKAAAVLAVLVARAGRPVTRDELFAAVWGETIIGDDALTSCIQELRAALADDAKQPRYIETRHRRGYRFVARVSSSPHEETARDSRSPALYLDILDRPTPGPRTARSGGKADPPEAGAGRPAHSVASVSGVAIGREQELAALRQELVRARHGEARLTAVLGEAGIGKTHLVEAHAVEAARSGLAVIHGRAYETERILPFGVWVGALRRSGVDAQAEVVKSLAPTWRMALSRLMPELADPGRIPPSASENHLRLFEAMAQLMGAWAAQRPVLVVLEDLHWADEVSVRLIAFLGRRLEGAPIAFVVTARLEDLDPCGLLRSALVELHGERRAVELVLPPLTRAATLSLVSGLLDAAGDADGPAEQIWSLSRGHPLVAVEAVKAVQEGIAVGGPGSTAIPARVRRVVLDRLARLGEPARRLASIAATIGRDFEFPVLRRAAAMEEAEAWSALDELLRKRLLQDSHERLEFSHDLIREVIDHELGQPRCEALHARVAMAIEEHYAGDLASHWSELAVHCRAGRLWNKALTYFRAAATQATQRGAYRDAVSLFEAALGVGDHIPDRREAHVQAVEIRLQLRDLFQLLEDPAAATVQLQEAEQLARALGDPRPLALVLNQLALRAYLAGSHGDALRVAAESIELARKLGDVTLEGWGLLRLGQVHHALADHLPAIDCLTRGGELAGNAVYRLARGMVSVITAAFRISSLAELGRFEEALTLGRQAVETAESAQHLFSMAFSLFWLGRAHLDHGDVAQALSVLERGHALVQRWQMAELVPGYAADLGLAYALEGRDADSAPLLERVRPARDANGARWLTRKADGYLLIGQLHEAQNAADGALQLARDFGERGHEAAALRSRGDIRARSDEGLWPQAADDYETGLALAEDCGLRPTAARCRLGLSRVLGRLGHHGLAAHHLAGAIAELTSLGMVHWIAEARALAEAGQHVPPAPARHCRVGDHTA
ncbi:MAG: BREX system ATP-binding domain-containing protein [Candidatus Rokuibacteriota bacterium]